MNESKPVNRIPFEEISSSAAWDFPSWDEGAKVIPSVKKKSAEAEKSEHERVEDIEEPEQQDIKPITAAQLQQISEEAEREGREHGYKQGYEQGFSEGEKKGLKLGEQKAYSEVKQRLDEEKERFAQLADALLDPVAMQDGELENLVLDMAVHLAKHLLGQELSADPSRLYHIVKHAAASLPAGAQNIRVYVHPDDVAPAQEASAKSGREWAFYPDAALGRGGCRIESSQSLIDFSVEQRLQQMLEEVRFRGDIDPADVAPVADYRPEAAPETPPADPPSRKAADAEPGRTAEEPIVSQQPQTSAAEKVPVSESDPLDPERESAGDGAASEGDVQPEADHSTEGKPGAGEDAASTHPFGNPWDGRRE